MGCASLYMVGEFSNVWNHHHIKAGRTCKFELYAYESSCREVLVEGSMDKMRPTSGRPKTSVRLGEASETENGVDVSICLCLVS